MRNKRRTGFFVVSVLDARGRVIYQSMACNCRRSKAEQIAKLTRQRIYGATWTVCPAAGGALTYGKD